MSYLKSVLPQGDSRTWYPRCGVPPGVGFAEGDLFIATGWRYEQDGRMHRCSPGEETIMRAVIQEEGQCPILKQS